MKILEDRIRKDGVVKEGNVLKVDRFLNHQIGYLNCFRCRKRVSKLPCFANEK